MADLPPMDPKSEEASPEQLKIARREGEAYGEALDHMVGKVADGGGQVRSGEYLVGYAVEKAEGMYELADGGLKWQEPKEENAHLEVAVRDAADGRFIPGLDVKVTLFDERGTEIGTNRHEMLWHPMLYHYGRNWKVPGDGTYRMRVEFEPPAFMRHDKVNGKRFTEPCRVEFEEVQIKTGKG